MADVSIIDDMVEHLASRRWEPLDVVAENDRLELYPLHGKVGVGFTLWQREPPADWTVVVNGHWEAVVSGNTIGGLTAAKFGAPVAIPFRARRRIQRLLHTARRRDGHPAR